MYGIAIDKDRLHSRGGGLRGGVKTTGTIASSVTVPFPLFQRRQSSECLPATQYDDLKRSHPLSYAENITVKNCSIDCDVYFSVEPNEAQYRLSDFTFENLNITANESGFNEAAVKNMKVSNVSVNIKL